MQNFRYVKFTVYDYFIIELYNYRPKINVMDSRMSCFDISLLTLSAIFHFKHKIYYTVFKIDL